MTVTKLRAGVARADITPPVGITHMPWGAATHDRAEGIDMPLYATALVVSDGDVTAAVVDVDLIGFHPAESDRIRAAVEVLTGIPRYHVRLTCTHNHSGPIESRQRARPGAEFVSAYLDTVPSKIAGAVWEAHRTMRPARIAAGSGRSSMAVNRRIWLESERRTVMGRNWSGFVDHEVVVARIDDEDEHPIAVIVNYAAHPTIMSFANRLITPDYPGPLRQTVERELGGTCLFLQGAAGNAHPATSFSSRREDYRHAGQVVGLEAARAALELRTVPRRERFIGVVESGAPLGLYEDEPDGEPDGRVRVRSGVLALPLRDLGDLVSHSARVSEAEDELKLAEARGAGETDLREVRWRLRRARMAEDAARVYAGQHEVPLEIHLITIGTVALVGVGGEPFMELGRAVKDASPFPHTLFSGYTNGSGPLGYLPTREAFAQGGYEVEWGTRYRPGAGESVASEAVKMLRELAAELGISA